MNEPEFRLILDDDYKAFSKLINKNREELKRYFPITVSRTNTLEDVKTYLTEVSEKTEKKQLYLFGLFHESELVSVLMVKNIDWRVPKCELAYFIDKEKEGKGIMTVLVNNTVSHCFEELKMKKVFLRISPDNLASKKIAEKTGFTKEGLLRKEFRVYTGELIDVEYYGKLDSE